MRLGVIDVGSNTVHLLVVDAHPGASPVPYHSQRSLLRLMRYLDEAGCITAEGVTKIVTAIDEAVKAAREIGVDDLIVTATSAIREAPNGPEVLRLVAAQTGEMPQVLSGEDEARITMLAVRRWFGWSAGEILLFDIGGGSFEIAQGADEYPDVQASLPLGAGRATVQFIPEDPPGHPAVSALRRHARAEFTRVRDDLFVDRPQPQMVVGTSKTIRSLGRLVSGSDNPVTGRKRPLYYHDLKEWEPFLREMPSSVREYLPGVTPERGYQLMAGAVLLRTAMKVFGVSKLHISPWALREGIVLRYIDSLDSIDDTGEINLTFE
ncbi:Ppx/GppA family phosphatase [Leucobacter sp. OH2974_COT-288]|uniref:Exopolyphosphatase/guanosine-5'-triphosphate, 3'-diphosphate pyrophosphatase n=1 Tax=Canibacter oris TaxID=1365628 RepID=A0A840DRA0_9MICO|nr:Ppx/GppA family phosphatase [Canibacter oris]MBB4071696.1 exopolyphosphatase/guanosine-5'-triphosphate,3'-diphosphate pyrophosphatase [Canibacter oris]RRD36430.1 Ppx/GppA family phosphatase [Leucobacter sp. OH2974_COT-288]